MKFSKATDYGLLLAVRLAHLESDTVTSVRVVAAECDVSERFLANIVHRLVSAGVVASRRGVKGGIRLARDAAEISVAEVVQALEGPIVLFDCQSTPSVCSREDCCSMKSFWCSVQDQLLEALAGAKIGDFVGSNARAMSPCGTSEAVALGTP